MKQRFFTSITMGFLICLASSHLYAQNNRPLILTFKDAIYLALRNNPTLESAELERVVQKYALVVAKNVFEPQYSLTASYNRTWSKSLGSSSISRSTDIQPSISLKNHYGTTFEVDSTNPTSGTSSGTYFNPTLSFSIKQPLIQGFGKAVVDEALNNALDAETSNKLSLKQTTISTINNIMDDYFDLMQAEQQLMVDRRTLINNEKLVANDKVKIAAGEIARTDIIQDEAQVATAQSAIQRDMNSLQQSRLTLLNEIGLSADSKVQLPKQIDNNPIIALLTGARTPASIAITKKLILANNPQYQIDGIGLRSLRRAVISAQDARNWKLDLSASEAVGGSGGAGAPGDRSFRSLSNHRNHVEQVGLDLTIPIDDVSAKSALISDKIALEKAEIAYNNEKRTLEITALTDRNSVAISKAQLNLDKQAAVLQNQTYKIAQLQHSAGKIASFDLIKYQQDLTTAELSLVADTINYLKSLITLDKDLGITLDLLGIKIRY